MPAWLRMRCMLPGNLIPSGASHRDANTAPCPASSACRPCSAGCLELDVVWRFPSAAAAVHAHGVEPSSDDGSDTEVACAGSLAPADAAHWRLLALGTSYERDTGHRGFVLRAGEGLARAQRLPECLWRLPSAVTCSAAGQGGLLADGRRFSRKPLRGSPTTLSLLMLCPTAPSRSGQAAPLPAPAVADVRRGAAHPGWQPRGGTRPAALRLQLLWHAAQNGRQRQVSGCGRLLAPTWEHVAFVQSLLRAAPQPGHPRCHRGTPWPHAAHATAPARYATAALPASTPDPCSPAWAQVCCTGA